MLFQKTFISNTDGLSYLHKTDRSVFCITVHCSKYPKHYFESVIKLEKIIEKN